MKKKLKIADINMRDPFIYVDKKVGRYHLFGTTAAGQSQRFDMYISTDLESWEGPMTIFEGKDHPDFWGTNDFWAPEVYFVEKLNAYIMFATVRGKTRKRGTVALISKDLLKDKFRPYSDKITPFDHTNLDGTLFYDKLGKPNIIYCHEWLEINDGSFIKAELSQNLMDINLDSIKVLFNASQIPWSISPKFAKTKQDYISDGPFVFRKDKYDYLLYSSFGKNGYQAGYCYTSDNWKTITHSKQPLTEANSGHAMAFTGLDQQCYIIYHADNESSRVIPTIKKMIFKKRPFTRRPILKLV